MLSYTVHTSDINHQVAPTSTERLAIALSLAESPINTHPDIIPLFMASTTSNNEVRRGSLHGQTQQLPSFSHFLSRVEQSESTSPHLGPFLLPQTAAPNTFRRDLFHPRNDYSKPRLRHDSPLSPPEPTIGQQSTGGRPLLPQTTYSPTSSEQQSPGQPQAQHAFRPHHEVNSSHGHPPVALAQHETGLAKTIVKETNIEGQGACYVYEDGTVCPKAINGDTVNPKWGTTKAGRPRKRLGQACNTCREKKIRCDPQVPKCAQCQKFGRECKFETGTRGMYKVNTASDTASPTTPEPKKDSGHDRHCSSTSAESPSEQLYSRENSRSSINVGSLLSPASTVVSDDPPPPPKKRRMSTSPHNEATTMQTMSHPAAIPHHAIRRSNVTRHPSQFGTGADPLTVDRQLSMLYLHQYLKNVNVKLYHILPEAKFLQWVQSSQPKSGNELLVLYAMMAFGATYSSSDHPDGSGHRQIFFTIAETMLDQARATFDFNIILGQLLLSFAAFACGNLSKAGQYNARALRTCYDLGLNTEEGLDRAMSGHDRCFGFNIETSKECIRRIFWLTYVGYSFQKYTTEHLRGAMSLHCNLRLPCDDTCYESGNIPTLPVFFYDTSNPQEIVVMPGIGIVAFLVEIATMLDEIMSWSLQPSASTDYRSGWDRFYQKTRLKLSAWDRKTRRHFWDIQRVGDEEDELLRRKSSEESSAGPTTGLHLLYHFVSLVLHRNLSHRLLTVEQNERHSKEAHNQAVRILDLVRLFDEDGGATIPLTRLSRVCPYTFVAIVTAVDVVTAAGAVSDVLEHQNEGREQSLTEMVSYGIEALSEISRYWQGAIRHLELVQKRLGTMLSSSRTSTKKAFFFREPMYEVFSVDQDVVYGLARLQYLRALGLGNWVRNDTDLMEMGV